VSDFAFNTGVRQVQMVHTPHYLPIFFIFMQIFKSEATHKHSLAWTWFSTIFAPTQQTLAVKDLDHSKSLSAGSLTPCMYRVWTKWLKVSLRLHVHL